MASAAFITCPHCGNEIGEEFTVCGQCGAEDVTYLAVSENERAKKLELRSAIASFVMTPWMVVAAVLIPFYEGLWIAAFFGGVGAMHIYSYRTHKDYSGPRLFRRNDKTLPVIDQVTDEAYELD